ncbi:MAG: NAD(+) diphosphatase [Chromatiales bacterium]|nr:NAD(+) diphosphatase [Chromatiales bacterium]
MINTTLNYYTGCKLDRTSERRDDSDWLTAALQRADCAILPVWRGKHPVVAGNRPLICDPKTCEALLTDSVEPIFLGLNREQQPWFVIDISHLENPAQHLTMIDEAEWLDLRRFGNLLDFPTGARLAYARAMVLWHDSHRFCNRCGEPTQLSQAGHQRLCDSSNCGNKLFPRIEPAVIMLIHDGDRCLLGRQAAWPPGRHSVLAGYVEPGESLEDAVKREVKEEVGLEITDIGYHSSQAWPFPASIMLGFYARATSFDITLLDNELESAAWFDRDALINNTIDGFLLPSRDSIAYQLIQDWLAGKLPA